MDDTMDFGLRGLGGEVWAGEIVGHVRSECAVSPEGALPQDIHLFYHRMCQQLHSYELYFIPGRATHTVKIHKTL